MMQTTQEVATATATESATGDAIRDADRDYHATKTMQMVSVRELTKVIAEADGGTDPSKDDGMVDYGEYLDFAADLLITLRAREHGRMMTMKADAVMDGNIRSIMHKQVPSPTHFIPLPRVACRPALT